MPADTSCFVQMSFYRLSRPCVFSFLISDRMMGDALLPHCMSPNFLLIKKKKAFHTSSCVLIHSSAEHLQVRTQIVKIAWPKTGLMPDLWRVTPHNLQNWIFFWAALIQNELEGGYICVRAYSLGLLVPEHSLHTKPPWTVLGWFCHRGHS